MKYTLLVLCIVVATVDLIASDICDGVPDQMYVRDPESCSSFYVCRDGQSPLFSQCLNDYWFNEETGFCDFQQNVNCHLFVSTTEIPTTDTVTRDPNVEEGIECPQIDNPLTIQFTPSLIDCERYYICYHGRPIPMRCLEGFYWNQATQLCDYPTSAQCALDPMPVDLICSRNTQGSLRILPHPTECELYYYCINGEAQVQQCPFLFHFDYEKQECLIKDKAHCFTNRNR